MNRIIATLLLVAATRAAEVARRDVQLALETADGGFTYALDSQIGRLTGSDAFDRLDLVRCGGRWAWSSAGATMAPLFGSDLEVLDAPLSGGGMSGYGATLCAGGTWAFSGPLSADTEAFWGMHRVQLSLPGRGGAGDLSGDGTLQRHGVRARLLWLLARHWSLAAEGGYVQWEAAIAADGARDLTLAGACPSFGLALAWRPSARPGGIE